MAINPDMVAIDGFLGGIQTISASSAPITLTSPAGFTPTPSGGPTQAQNGVLRFTGALTSAVQVTLPIPGFAIIENLTTGAFVLSFRAIGSGQVIAIQQGSAKHVYNDGTNVRFVNLPDVGTYLDIATSTVPAWITACTIPPYLNCDGTTFNASTYPYLNSFLGGNTLPDSRGRNRFALSQGTGRLTTGGAGIDGTTLLAAGGNNGIVAGQLPPITSNGSNFVTVFPQTGGVNIPVNNSSISAVFVATTGSPPQAPVSGGNWGSVTSFAGANNIAVTSNNTGGSVMPNAAPGYVGGLVLIRAA